MKKTEPPSGVFCANGALCANLKQRAMCSFLSYQARLKLALKREENIYILTTRSFQFSLTNHALCQSEV